MDQVRSEVLRKFEIKLVKAEKYLKTLKGEKRDQLIKDIADIKATIDLLKDHQPNP